MTGATSDSLKLQCICKDCTCGPHSEPREKLRIVSWCARVRVGDCAADDVGANADAGGGMLSW